MAAVARTLARLEKLAKVRVRTLPPAVQAIQADPTYMMVKAGMQPDPWQANLLRSRCTQTAVVCCRQSGKSTAAAALSLRTALLQPRALVLLLAPSMRQSQELFRKVTNLWHANGSPLSASLESALRLELSNGSRIIALPGNEETVRGFSGVSLLVVDEASRVCDELYFAIRPMLAVSKGRIAALSTPFGKRGWFYEAWTGSGSWERLKVTAAECPRISSKFLEEERLALGPRWFRQEYECAWEEASDAVFATGDIAAAFADDTVRPLYAAG
jgi:hypothetical protein